MSFIDRRIRLFDNADSLGLTCGPSGVSLAGVPLLVATPSGYAPRPAQEIGDLLKAAYGASLEPARLTPGLAVIAEALNRADLGRAMVAALHLRLPALGADDAARLAKAVESLAKFNRDQPRDWHGRWTADGGTAPSNASSPTPGQRPGQRGTGDEDRPHLDPSQPPRSKGPSHTAGSVVPEAQGGWRKPAHLYGGRLIPIQGGGAGSNFPPPDPVPVPEAEPNINAPSVPLGWDNHGHTKDGITYPTVRVPRLPNGSPWPEATYDVIRTTLTRSGAGMPNMRLLIPIDGIGPILVGSTPTFEYPTPEGYDEVEFRGTPQMTRSRGDETRHAWDSIDMALQFARTNRYSRIFFNRSWARITDRMIQSRIRPDVVAEARLNLRLTPRYRPYEILSPGQSLRQRQEDYPIHPEIAPVEGHKYKTLRWIKALLYLSDYPRQPDLSQQLAKRRDQGVPRALAGRRRLRPPSWRLVKTNKT